MELKREKFKEFRYLNIDYDGNSIHRKQQVVNEIKRGAVYQQSASSDSDRENEIYKEMDNDPIYGKTPPREVRRSKNKLRDIRFCSSMKSVKKQQTSHHFNWQQKKERRLNSSKCQAENIVEIPRLSKLVRVNSTKSLRSIVQKKATTCSSSPRKPENVTPSVITKALKIYRGEDNQTSRMHFYKLFSRLVRLGGRADKEPPPAFEFQEEELLEDDQWQVELPELLWLELQAWHAGKQVEEEDIYLEEARTGINDILDEVINYKFSSGNCTKNYEDLKTERLDMREFRLDSIDCEEEFLTMKFDKDSLLSSSPTPEEKLEQNMSLNRAEDNFTNPGSAKKNFISKFKEMNLESHQNSFKVCTQNNVSGDPHVAAMEAIIDIIKRVEKAERLYPSLSALATAHPKYKDVKFQRNLEAMIFWLGVNKELHHKMNTMAEWIDVDPDDILTWQDWFEHGLNLSCIKTKRSYQNKLYLSTADLVENALEGSASFNSHMNLCQRKFKVDKRKKISEQHRKSFIENTRTSRYRSFAEREMRNGGVSGLIVRIKGILHRTLDKTRYGLFECGDLIEETYLAKGTKEPLYDDPRFHKLLELLQDFSPSNSLLENFLKERAAIGNRIRGLVSHQWGKICQDMRLPSVADKYSFISKIPIDVIHECMRFRLDYKPKVQLSKHSIRQLLNECKEVLVGGIVCMQGMEYLVLIPEESANAKKERKIHEEEFYNDMKALLDLYFDYLQSWFKMLNQSSGQSLKNIMEEEWKFVKDICSYTQGGECKAGYKFCAVVSDLLRATGHDLENSVDELSAGLNLIENVHHQRQKISTSCKKFKDLFKEFRERSIQALGFAKMLQKELGIAAQYDVNTSYEKLFQLLNESRHKLVEYPIENDFMMFVSANKECKAEDCLNLIRVTFGIGDPDELAVCKAGYVLLVRRKDPETLWRGRRCNLEYSPEMSLSLSYIKLDRDMMLISSNSYQLNTQRKYIDTLFGEDVVVVEEQTSSHDMIAKALCKVKESAIKLAEITSTTIKFILQLLCFDTATELDEADKNTMRKTYIETMHCCFSFGFEYLRELIRLFHHRKRASLYPYLLSFSKEWISFVMTKTERGRGTKPRWAAQGLEFLLVAIDPGLLESLGNEEFRVLQKDMNDCIIHIIGHAEPKKRRRLRGTSPFSIHRSRSVPLKRHDSGNSSTQERSEKLDKHLSLPSDFDVNHGTSSLSLPDVSESISGDSDYLDGSSLQEVIEEESVIEAPIMRVKKALQEIDERRTAKLQHMRVIGNVTYKKAKFASDMVHLNIRRVNFKWQMGNKIGEGQFGKVYSAVNLDTGELMAIKQIRFNPHDYGTIQEIADEITSIEAVQHECLVKYFGVEVHKDEMLIFMEYCADGTIAEICKLDIPEALIRVYTYQITKAINFLHENGIIHRDIKGANIFVSSSGLIKIGDFGSAVKLKDALATSQGEVFSTRGTAAFMAPEVITLDKGRGYGRAADVWSLGCVVVEMATGKQPWVECDNIYAIMFKVGDGQHPPIPERLSEEGQHFLKMCFVHDQRYRWTAHMLEDHPFVKSEGLDYGNHDVLIKIDSCALSNIVYSFLEKFCEPDEEKCFPVGKEISGVVQAVGAEVTRFQINDEIAVKKPDAVSYVDAAAGIGDALKAYTCFYYQAKLSSAETVVVAGATKGFGIMAIQLAQYIGAKVIAVGSTDEEIVFLKSMEPAPDQVVDLRNTRRNIVTVCLEETGGLGVDCFIDDGVELYSEEFQETLSTKQGLFPAKNDILSSLAVGGRWITTQSNLQIDPPDSEILMLKCASIHYLFEHSWSLSRGAVGRYLHILSDIMKKMEEGILRPMVHHTVLLDDCIESMKQVDEATIGKVVVKIA